MGKRKRGRRKGNIGINGKWYNVKWKVKEFKIIMG